VIGDYDESINGVPNVLVMKTGVFLLLLTACAGLSAPNVPTTIAASIVTPTPVCSAYVGTDDLEDVDLAALCTTALELIPLLDECEKDGGQVAECLDWATTSSAAGGAGFTGYTDEQMSLMLDLGSEQISRRQLWNATYDLCRMSHGEQACQSAVTDETHREYP
jgi:hypothetical protein